MGPVDKYVISIIFVLAVCLAFADRQKLYSYKSPQESKTGIEVSDTASDKDYTTGTDRLSNDMTVYATDDDAELEDPVDYAGNTTVECLNDSMIISFPKYILYGAEREHLRLKDPSCKATENETHFFLKTSLLSCGTAIKHANSSVIYSNIVLPAPEVKEEVVAHVPDFEIPFRCCYLDHGLVSSIGVSPASRKTIFSKKGYGKFTIRLDLYPDSRYLYPYTEDDFPITKKLRERIYVEVSVDTADHSLSILAEDCYATPEADKKSSPKYWIIRNGCQLDETVEYHLAPNERSERLSFESFQFIGKHYYVFFHCHVRICNASDPYSRCALGCQERKRRDVLQVKESSDQLYRLTQGPLLLPNDHLKYRHDEKNDGSEAWEGYNVFLIAVLVAMSVICVAGASFVTWQKRRIVNDYTALANQVQ